MNLQVSQERRLRSFMLRLLPAKCCRGYAGRTREVVTQYMIRLRKQGYVRYSRNRILLNPDTLKPSIG